MPFSQKQFTFNNINGLLLNIKVVMKTKIIKISLLFLITVLTTSCYTVYQVVHKTYNYNESKSFKIDKIEEGTKISTGNGYWNASRGNKFVFVYLTLKNYLDQKQELDFDNFILLNPRTKTKHKPEWAMVDGPINIWGRVDSYIGKGAEKQRKLVFLYPEEDKAKILMVKDKIIEIEYPSTAWTLSDAYSFETRRCL